jgi:serine/threonine protein kinase
VTTQAGYPAPGEMIGPFRVGRRLGGGTMGVVLEAYDEPLNRQVALKVISPHLADDPGFRARFTREAQARASLDSAHVVHVYAHGEAGGRLYIATRLVPDGDLGLMLQQYGAPPVRTALDVIGQVATGLAVAHAAGLVHRDILGGERAAAAA